MLNDRGRLIAMSCDKLRSKEYALELSVPVARTIWSGTDLRQLLDVPLPSRWVLKPNHGSGQIYFGEGRVRSLAALELATRGWLGNSGPARRGEWGYTRARRLFLVEEMLGGEMVTPTSLKVYVFHGQPRMIAMISVTADSLAAWRMSSTRTWPPAGTGRRFYTSEWTPLELREGTLPLAEPSPAPSNLDRLLETAGRLGAPFDFVRVDLYHVGGVIYFGELTVYPGAGLSRLHPAGYDLQLGALWKVDRGNSLAASR